MKSLVRLAVLISTFLGRGPGVRADDERDLGGLLYGDVNLSLNRNQSCATCHGLQPVPDRASGHLLPAPGFVDPDNVRSNTPVSSGSVPGQFGFLNAPSAAYAAFSPAFHWDGDDETYVGGQFWNGRANDLQGQAALPFLNPAEMAMPSRWAVVTRIREDPAYAPLFERVYGIRLSDLPPAELAPATDVPPASVLAAYEAATQAISEFERGPAFRKFNSKFDFWIAGRTELTAAELRGFNLFTNETKANCSACHPSSPGRDVRGRLTPPLFTDFSYDNLGLPRNERILGNPPPDPGLGGRADLASGPHAAGLLGKQKVMTLRNIAVTPPYGHNGVFETLEQVVHFYNTRDTLGRIKNPSDPGFGVTGWPEPEVPENVNAEELGNLGLSAAEEADLVAFLRTLTDDYPESGADPQVPPGTPSPFTFFEPDAIPVRLEPAGRTGVRLSGRLGKFYRIEVTDSLGAGLVWKTVSRLRLSAQGSVVTGAEWLAAGKGFYRVVQED